MTRNLTKRKSDRKKRWIENWEIQGEEEKKENR